MSPPETQDLSQVQVRADCSHFNGYKPCRPHKLRGVHCKDCPEFTPQGPNLLIIKLQAAGEVIRNTPLLHRIKKEWPNARIFWLTRYPDLIPKDQVFKVLPWSFESTLILKDIEFDLLYSLDKDLDACALANQIRSKVKKGFIQKNGAIVAFDEDARPKWVRGVFDDLMKASTLHYVEETFEVCGFKFQDEPYLLPKFSSPQVGIDRTKRVIALNTGVGDAWKPRRYSVTRWSELARKLIETGHEVFLAGGQQEDAINREIAQNSGAKYFGTFPMLDFMGLLDQADVIVSGVSFAFHVGVGLGKKIVLLNNTFNRHEFYMYGRGVVLEPKLDCLMCYKNDFDANCVTRDCMDLISAQTVFEAVVNSVRAPSSSA